MNDETPDIKADKTGDGRATVVDIKSVGETFKSVGNALAPEEKQDDLATAIGKKIVSLVALAIVLVLLSGVLVRAAEWAF